MDEYKEYIYSRAKTRFNRTDTGDISEQLAIREKLQCKPFKWFIKEVAFDLPKRYPPVEPLPYAKGIIQSIANPKLCLDSLGHSRNQEVGLYQCSNEREEPQYNQNFQLTIFKDIRLRTGLCLDVSSYEEKAPVLLYACHHLKGHQLWKYNKEDQLLEHGTHKKCLDYNSETLKVYLSKCDKSNLNMKWEWGYLNETALLHWDELDVSFENVYDE